MRFSVVVASAVVMMAGATAPLASQGQDITGVVVSEAGQPLSNVRIVVEGTAVAGVTNATGQFRITGMRGVAGAEVTIRALRIGYQAAPQTVRLGATDVRIVMSDAALILDEVVVTGTAVGSQARSLGNPIARVEVSNVVEVAPTQSMQDLLRTNVSGVSVVSSPGGVGTGAAVRIRGGASLSLGSAPIVYVDGVRIDNDQNAALGNMRGGAVSRLNDLNSEEIESIEVIKGPAAATLFGTEASAGVIQITTKKGRGAAATWDVTVKQGATWLSNPVSRWPAVFDKSTTPCTNCELLANGIRRLHVLESEIQQGIGTPWVTGHNQSYGVAVRGATGVVGYYFSGQFDRDEGYVDWNWQNKFSTRANLEITPTQKLGVSTTMGFLRSTTRYDAAGPYPAELNSSIYWGNPKQADTRTRGWYLMTPEALATVEAKELLNRFTTGVSVRHSPFSWLTHKLTAGADIGTSNPSRMIPRTALGASDLLGVLNLGHMEATYRSVTYVNVDYGATALVRLPGDLVAETSGGLQFYTKSTHETGAVGDQFPAPGKGTVSSAAQKTGFEDYVENKTLGGYLQEQFGWKNRRFVTAGIRGDDNSAFGSNFNFVLYPKLSVAWVLHEEPFWKVGPVDALKLRAAWGRAGRQPDVFAAQRLYAPITAANDQPGLTPDAVGNPDLKPEVGEELEAGVDVGALGGRLTAHFTYYNKNTKDAILRKPVAPSTGFSGVQFVNAGLIRNRGVELEVKGRILESQNVEWDLGLTLSTNQSLIVSLGGLPPIITSSQQQREGYPVGAVFLRHVISAEFDASGKIVNDRCEATPEQGGGTVPCSQAQAVYRGPALPTWEGGADLSLVLFRNLTLFARVDYQGGYMKISGDVGASHVFFRNSQQIFERTDPILATIDEIIGGADFQQVGLVKGGFAKLRTVSAMYALPRRLVAKVGASRGSISLAVRNPATLWWQQRDAFGRRQIDPEMSGQYTSASDISAYYQTKMPISSVLTVTARLGF